MKKSRGAGHHGNNTRTTTPYSDVDCGDPTSSWIVEQLWQLRGTSSRYDRMIIMVYLLWCIVAADAPPITVAFCTMDGAISREYSCGGTIGTRQDLTSRLHLALSSRCFKILEKPFSDLQSAPS